MWVWNCNQLGIYPVTQNHDDSVYIVDEDKAVETTELIEKAMDRVNAQLGLRVKLACETQIGDNLSETH
jgi:DNA polymerase I-like protein with 3'-5' exonuclease and polymerase domains